MSEGKCMKGKNESTVTPRLLGGALREQIPSALRTGGKDGVRSGGNAEPQLWHLDLRDMLGM